MFYLTIAYNTVPISMAGYVRPHEISPSLSVWKSVFPRVLVSAIDWRVYNNLLLWSLANIFTI